MQTLSNQDLSVKAETLNPREVFKLFIKSVFYVGKGKQSRPYAHLFEASLQNKVSSLKGMYLFHLNQSVYLLLIKLSGSPTTAL